MGMAGRKRGKRANVERPERLWQCLRARAMLASWGMKLFIFVGVNLGGYVGWELGGRFGLMTAFLLSGVGSVLGVFAGWWAARKMLA